MLVHTEGKFSRCFWSLFCSFHKEAYLFNQNVEIHKRNDSLYCRRLWKQIYKGPSITLYFYFSAFRQQTQSLITTDLDETTKDECNARYIQGGHL